jgi:hypothetical protein
MRFLHDEVHHLLDLPTGIRHIELRCERQSRAKRQATAFDRGRNACSAARQAFKRGLPESYALSGSLFVRVCTMTAPTQTTAIRSPGTYYYVHGTIPDMQHYRSTIRSMNSAGSTPLSLSPAVKITPLLALKNLTPAAIAAATST